MKNHYIYIIYDVKYDKFYIGKCSTNKPIEKDNYLGSGKRIKNIQKHYKRNNLDINKRLLKEILEVSSSYEENIENEKKWIWFFDSVKSDEFYNIAEGGDGGKVYIQHPLLGKKLSKDTKNKISKSLKKYQITDSHRENLSKAMKKIAIEKKQKYGYCLKLTDKQKKNISKKRKEYFLNGGIHPKGMLGKNHSEEHKEKMRTMMSGENNPMYGIDSWSHMSKEQKAKRIEGCKNTWKNKPKEDMCRHKEKISIAMKGGNNPRAKKCCLKNNDIIIQFGCIRDVAKYLYVNDNPKNLKLNSIEYNLKQTLRNENKKYLDKYILRYE